MLELLLLRLGVLLAIIGGVIWTTAKVRHLYRPPRNLLKEAAEKTAAFPGPITALELSFEMDIAPSQAQRLLEDLVTEGLANVTVVEDGRMVYDIPKLYGTPKLPQLTKGKK